MCRICDPVYKESKLTPKPHDEDACKLRKAMHCALCGKGSHFQDECPLKISPKPFQSPDTQTFKRSLPLKARTENPYVMSNTVSAYVEYLRAFGVEVSTDLDTARELVEDHLAGRGYLLENPIEPSSLFPKPKPKKLLKTKAKTNVVSK